MWYIVILRPWDKQEMKCAMFVCQIDKGSIRLDTSLDISVKRESHEDQAGKHHSFMASASILYADENSKL